MLKLEVHHKGKWAEAYTSTVGVFYVYFIAFREFIPCRLYSHPEVPQLKRIKIKLTREREILQRRALLGIGVETRGFVHFIFAIHYNVKREYK